MKEVYHSGDKFLKIRRLVSGYEDLIKLGVRLKNQRYSLLRACGLSGEEKKGEEIKLDSADDLILRSIERQIDIYEEEKEMYVNEFYKLKKEHAEIRHQDSIPGIGIIGAVTIVARVVSPNRFIDGGHYLSYAGLVKLEKKSGEISYGRKNSRYCRQLKSAYKVGVMASIGGKNEINDCYEYLIKEKGYAEYNARHKASRRLALISLGVLRSGKSYKAYKERKKNVENKSVRK